MDKKTYIFFVIMIIIVLMWGAYWERQAKIQHNNYVELYKSCIEDRWVADQCREEQ